MSDTSSPLLRGVGYGNLCAFLMSLLGAAFWVGVPYVVIDWYHAEAWHLGLLAALGSLAYIATCLLAGKTAKRLKRHHMMAMGALTMAVSLGLVIVSPSLWFIMGLMVLGGVGQALFWVALIAHLSDGVGPTELRKRMGWFNLSWSAGEAVGFFAGGAFYGLAKWTASELGSQRLQAAPAAVTGVLVLLIAVIALAKLKSAPAGEEARNERDETVPRSPERGGQSSLRVFWIMSLVANAAAMALWGVIINIFPDFGKGVLGYSEQRWGILLGVACTARTAGFLYLQRNHAWEYRAKPLFWLQALLPLAAATMVFNSNYWVFIAVFALVGVGFSKTYYASIFYSMDCEHSHEERGGIHEAALSVGNLVPLAAGILASASGLARSPYALMLVLLAGAMAVQGVMYARRARNTP